MHEKFQINHPEIKKFHYGWNKKKKKRKKILCVKTKMIKNGIADWKWKNSEE